MDSAQKSTIRKPFIEHVHELRKRLMWCFLVFGIGGAIGYGLYEPMLELVQRPLAQTLYFTSPTGGFNFVFKLCAAFGLVFALPVLTYHAFKFLEPVTKRQKRLTVFTYLVWSFDLAYAGILFGYLVSLPAALHFLTQFGGDGIQALITADEYFSFALAYIIGFALLFQLPLIVLFINRIKPLKPGGMMKAQRYVILVSFIVAAILTPTPDPLNQLIMAVPIVLLYQVSILMVWLLNLKRKPKNKSPSKIQRNISTASAKQAPPIVAQNEGVSKKVVPARSIHRPLPQPVRISQINDIRTRRSAKAASRVVSFKPEPAHSSIAIDRASPRNTDPTRKLIDIMA